MQKRLHVVFGRIGLVLISTLLSLAIGEVLARRAAPAKTVIFWADTLEGITTARPSQRGRLIVPDTFDLTISISSQRFRGTREFSLEPPQGVLRIAALGDSMTFGWGANDEETYPAQLERILTDSTGPGNVEVINAGVCAVGTGEQALYYDVWVRRFSPHLVILNVFENDVGDDEGKGFFFRDADGHIVPRGAPQGDLPGEARYLPSPNAEPFSGYYLLGRNSRLFSLLRDALLTFRGRYVTTPSARFFGDSLPILAGEINWLNTRVRESGSQLVVMYLPSLELIYSSQAPWAERVRTRSAAIVRWLEESCSKSRIPFVDVTPAVRERSARSGKRLYYQELDGHPTPEGYRGIAEAVAQFLLEEGLIPRRAVSSPVGSTLPSSKQPAARRSR